MKTITKNIPVHSIIENDFILHTTTIEEATVLLKTDTDQGLTIDEAKERLERHGLNSIAEATAISPLRILLNQFKSPIVFLLVFAAGMSFWFKEWLDGTAILLVLIINAAIGFYMELKAHKSVAALKKLSSIPAKVLRGGKLFEINAEEIVPGDIVFTEAGDMIPADGRIYKAAQLLIDESALTGESVPVEKKDAVLAESTILGDRTNMAFKATHVSKGNAYILVGSTGMKTELGKIANLVHSAKQAATPLEKKLEEFSKKTDKNYHCFSAGYFYYRVDQWRGNYCHAANSCCACSGSYSGRITYCCYDDIGAGNAKNVALQCDCKKTFCC